MTLGNQRGVHSLDDIREAFDQRFAEPEHVKSSSEEGYLVIRVASDFYVLRVSEVSGLLKNIKIVPVPSQSSEFIGIAGHRGRIIPVYDIGRFLDDSTESTSSWLALARTQADEPLGLAFDEYIKFLNLPENQLVPHAGTTASSEFIQDAIHTDIGTIRILAITPIIEAIRRRNRLENQPKEQ